MKIKLISRETTKIQITSKEHEVDLPFFLKKEELFDNEESTVTITAFFEDGWTKIVKNIGYFCEPYFEISAGDNTQLNLGIDSRYFDNIDDDDCAYSLTSAQEYKEFKTEILNKLK